MTKDSIRVVHAKYSTLKMAAGIEQVECHVGRRLWVEGSDVESNTQHTFASASPHVYE